MADSQPTAPTDNGHRDVQNLIVELSKAQAERDTANAKLARYDFWRDALPLMYAMVIVALGMIGFVIIPAIAEAVAR